MNIFPAFWFIAPALSLILVFFFLPVFAALIASFTDFDIYALGDLSNMRWIGFGNYQHSLNDPLFWKAFNNTLYFVIAAGPLSIGVSLIMALLVNQRWVKLKSLFRTLFFLPVVTTLVAVAVVWRYLYHPRYGFFNHLLAFFDIAPIDWLGDPAFAMPSIIAMAIWKNFGFNMILFIAGLRNIPANLYEAAMLDGANAWQQFCHITFPMLMPIFNFVTVITLIGYFQLFAEPYVMTQGGPAHKTLSLALLMFQEGFRWWNMGYASAMAFMLFMIVLSCSGLQLALKKNE